MTGSWSKWKRSRTLGLGSLVCLGCLGPGATPGLAQPLDGPARRSMAEAFAPRFTFHPQETYFPTWPVPVGNDPGGTCCLDRGDAETRARQYEGLPRAERLASAVVFYRVVTEDPSLEPGQLRLEYWLYYLANRYEVRGALVPYRVNGDHSHDLEQVFLTVERRPGAPGRTPADYELREVWASAHAGSVANNHYRWPAGSEAPRPWILVELGGHAMAPDVNRDHRYDPAVDASGDRTFVWGVRDSGQSWARFNGRYSEPRPEDQAVELRPRAEASPDDGGASGPDGPEYRLRPVSALEALVRDNGWLVTEAAETYDRRSWTKRFFGEVDTRTLLAPSRHPHGRDASLMRDRTARVERGVAIGFTPLLSPFTSLVSGRYSRSLGPGYAPKIMVNGATLLMRGRAIGELDASLWYPVDAITKVLVGAQARTDLFTWERDRTSTHAGVEFRVGPWRWRLLLRWGPAQATLDFKMYYFVWP